MKAKATNLSKFLNAPKQFIIPVYQRTYSWKRQQCIKLLDDIVRIGADDNNPGHFIGSVVYIEKGLYNVTAVPELLVIDGQHRKSTRLNSSHVAISYAVFCLNKKNRNVDLQFAQ